MDKSQIIDSVGVSSNKFVLINYFNAFALSKNSNFYAASLNFPYLNIF